MIRNGLLCLLLLLLSASAGFAQQRGTVFTLWPLLDYRSSPDVDYAKLSLLGPFIKYERKGNEREFGVRPLFFRAEDVDGEANYSEYLYPVATAKTGATQRSFQGIHLLNYDFGTGEEAGENDFTFFPFVFYGSSAERGAYFAVFPFGGTIHDLFGREEIRFALFPLYGRTLKKGTSTTNWLWPFFASIRGENETGIKFWPFYGASQKEGVYRKRFYLWPVVFHYDLGLNTDNPLKRRAVFPFYVGDTTPTRSEQTYLWPFFSHIEDRARDYEEWNFPWPLLRVSEGSYKEGVRVLPFYADEKVGDRRSRWFLWPLYKIEEIHTEVIERRRDRILYFLYSDLEETVLEEESPRKERVALWPLFTYEQTKGVSHFYTLSLLEPFFPDNASFARNWSPLWRLYQHKWDTHGNEVSSFLWNLYWKEKRGGDLAMEIFPLFFYQRETEKGLDLKVLKGLFRYRSAAEGSRINLFYLPWGIHWGGDAGQGEDNP